MIKAFGNVPPVLIGYYRPHNSLSFKRKCRQVSIDVRKNQTYIYEQEEFEPEKPPGNKNNKEKL